MKKRHIALGLALLVLAVAYLQRSSIALKVLPKGLETAMTADTIADLGDGLHVALCGAGGPLPDPKRSGACVAVVAGGKLFAVDAGTNGARNLVRMRLPQGSIEAVFLTHFHSDHIDGLGEMATGRWVQANNTAPMPVYGPQGVDDVVDGFNKAYSHDAIYRHDHHGDTVADLRGTGMSAVSFPIPTDGELLTVYNEDGVTVQMLAVDHYPVAPAVGYLFSYKGRTALISGDTDYSPNLEKHAKGVDLLVHEALSPELVKLMNSAAEKTDNPIIAKITFDIVDYHASPIEAAETARNAGVGHLLYYHIVPVLILPGMEAAWLEGVDDIFNDYTLGEDGTTFSLPANSKEIIKIRQGM